MFCITDFKQINLEEQISSLNSLISSEPIKILELFKEHFDINKFIPISFINHYSSKFGPTNNLSLSSILTLLLTGHLFKIPSTKLLLLFLSFSPYLQDFCKFDDKLPDESFLSRFKTTFEHDLFDFFKTLSFHTNSICSEIDESLDSKSDFKGFSSTLIFDTSGFKPKVKENNPKTIQSEINRFKSYAKVCNNPDFNPYAAAYNSLPKESSVNSSIKLDFVNGHYGYFYKFGLLTNGLGIPLHVHFFNEDFYSSIDNSFESFEEQKYTFDNASLKPVLSSFFHKENSSFNTFMADSEFDSYDNFGLLRNYNFSKAFIPINSRNSSKTNGCIIPTNTKGTPLCPLDGSEFIPKGPVKGKNRSFRLKYICPKSFRIKGTNKYSHTCSEPCRQTNSVVTEYKYPHKDFRLYPGVQRNSDEWVNSYKKRTCIERSIAYLKSNYSIAFPNTYSTSTMRSELVLALSSKLLLPILAYSINKPGFIRNIKSINSFNKLLKFVA